MKSGKRGVEANDRARAYELAAPALLFIVAIAVYLPALGGGFVWDDKPAILENTLLRRPGGLWEIWSTIGRIPGEEHYWPLTYSALWLELRMWGESAARFHLGNLILHGAIAVQIWRLMRRIGLPGAWLGAALFAVHPVHVEAVAWVIGIKDLLATFFCLLAFEFYLMHDERGGWKWLIAAACAAEAAMLGKSSPVTMAAGLAILIWYRRGRFKSRDAVGVTGFAAVTLAMAIVDRCVASALDANAGFTVPPLTERLMQAGRAFWLYVEKLVWPVSLGPVYPKWHFNAGNAAQWLPLFAIVAITVILWLARRRTGRGPLACWLFYGVTLAPVLGVVYFEFLSQSPAADRYQYLPSVGPLAGIGALIGGWIDRKSPSRRALPIGLASALCVVLAGLTWRQAGFYRGDEVFFAHAAEVNPQSAFIQFNLGNAAWERQNYSKADLYFAEAVRLQPDYWPAYGSRGLMLVGQGRAAEAVEWYRRALDAGCAYPGVLSNAAWLMATSPDPRVRDPQKAIAIAEQCVREAKKMDPMFLNSLAAAQASVGRTKDASITARKAADLARRNNRPDMVRSIETLIRIYYDRGRPYTMPNKK